MNKKTIIMLSLIVTILSMIYMIAVYYGFLRYVLIHNRSVNYYSEGYAKLDKAHESDKVVISFTVDKDRLDKLDPFINSLLDQTVRIDEIAMSIPYKYMGMVPKHLGQAIRVYGYSVDYDDTGKLIPVVLREEEANTKIILVDDRMIYGKDFIEDMVNASDENPKKVVFAKNEEIKWGVLIKPLFFDTKIAEYKKGTGCAKWLGKCVNTKSISMNYSETYVSWRK